MDILSLIRTLRDLLFPRKQKEVKLKNPVQSGPVTLSRIAQDSVTGFDRRLKYPWDKKLEQNAEDLKNKLNQLYKQLPVNLKSSFHITSAYRPGVYNERVGGAENSLHTTCEAVDLANINNVLGTWVLENLDVMDHIGLWVEHPEATMKTRHLHLQTRPPGSGRRVFWP